MQPLSPLALDRRSWFKRHPILTALIAIPTLLFICVWASWIPHNATVDSQGARIADAKTPLELAQAATINGHDVGIDSDDTTGIIAVSETLPLEGTNLNYRNSVMEDCFNIQRAMWQRYPHLQELDVSINGPLIDKNGNESTGAMGHCYLQWANATHMPWDQLGYKDAWQAYNNAGFSLAVSN